MAVNSTEDDNFNLLMKSMFDSGQLYRRLRVAQIMMEGNGQTSYSYVWVHVTTRLRAGWEGPGGMSDREIRETLFKEIGSADPARRKLMADVLNAMNMRGLLLAARDAGVEEAREVLLEAERPEGSQGGHVVPSLVEPLETAVLEWTWSTTTASRTIKKVELASGCSRRLRARLAVLEQALLDVAQNGDGVLALPALPQALARVRERETAAGAGHADEEQAALLCDVAARTKAQRQEAILAAGDEHDVELEPLGRVQREQRNAVGAPGPRCRIRAAASSARKRAQSSPARAASGISIDSSTSRRTASLSASAWMATLPACRARAAAAPRARAPPPAPAPPGPRAGARASGAGTECRRAPARLRAAANCRAVRYRTAKSENTCSWPSPDSTRPLSTRVERIAGRSALRFAGTR